MPRYLIEGCNDGSLFAEAIDADNQSEAEEMAVERLCEAWRLDYDPTLTLDDMGDLAIVMEYSRADYIREQATDIYDLIADLSRLPIQAEARWQESGNDNAVDGLIKWARNIVSTIPADAP